jgi:hypothetical protein
MRRCSIVAPVGTTRHLKKRGALLKDHETEADEMFQNAVEKGTPQWEMEDPPRRRANNGKDLGTMQNDRPPIQGVMRRTSGQIRLTVCDNTQQWTIQSRVERATAGDGNGAHLHAYGAVHRRLRQQLHEECDGLSAA